LKGVERESRHSHSSPNPSKSPIRCIGESRTEDYQRRLSPQKARSYNKSEEKFFQWLDGEIRKIDEFYRYKEDNCVKRFKVLSEQLDHLTELKTSQRRAEQSGLLRRCTRAFQTALSTTDPSTDQVDYAVARERLKEATLESYREMELLREYRVLNRKALLKILKKFDKVSDHKASSEYQSKIRDMALDRESISELMDHTEVRIKVYLLIRIYTRGTLNTGIEITQSSVYVFETSSVRIHLHFSESAFSLGSPFPF